MFEQHAMMPVLEWPTYGSNQFDKTSYLLNELTKLTHFHDGACLSYHHVLQKFIHPQRINNLADLPFLPVRLFKHEKLLSVRPEEVVKTMTSSGTSGQSVSQIFLDKETSAMQVKVLSRIMSEFIGPKRLPMLVIDCRATIANRYNFSARAAGILGFSIFGRDTEFALNDDMTLDINRVRDFAKKHQGQKILLFGFTFIVWKHLVKILEDNGEALCIEQGVLVHGGGWKQLENEAVAPKEFKARLKKTTCIDAVHNYYGMVEQTGSIFMECEQGHLHSSAWSEIIVRDPQNFKPLPYGKNGLIQLLSVIPRSYPGHSLLSEDEGQILGVDDCVCGRKGTYFKVLGRMKNAEVRGCSDTYTK